MSVERETEEKIFEAARKIFQARGFEGARMQEIADEAKINKSMLHYYYRNKDNLFFEVFQAGIKKIFPHVFAILNKEISLKAKISEVVNFYHTAFQENSQLPSFVIFEMNQNPERFKAFIKAQGFSIPQAFIDQVQTEIAEKQIIPIKPHQLLMNIISLCMMPMIARNMVQSLFKMDDGKYGQFLDERRELIPNFIYDGILYREENK